jgi:hypothetical protein
MPMLVIQHKVGDFAAWKKAFDSDPMGRARNGVIGHSVYRLADDPGSVVVNLEFSTLEEAQKFLLALREMWRRVGDKIGFGGAEGVQAHVLDEVERVGY